MKTKSVDSIDNKKQQYDKQYKKSKSFWDKNYGSKFKNYKNAFDGTLRRDTIAAWRGNYNIPTAFATVRTELVRTKRGLLNDPAGNFWGLSPVEWSEKNQAIADVHGFILDKQRETGHWGANLHSILEDGIKQGAGWAKIEWAKEEQISEYYDMKEGKIVKVKEKDKKVIIDGNVIKWVNNMNVFPDPSATNYWNCRYIIEVVVLTKDELTSLKDKMDFNESEYAKLLQQFKTQKDKEDFNGYYIYGKDYTVLVVEGYLLIDGPNEYKHGKIRLVPFVKYPDAGNVIGKGVIEIIYDLCGLQNKVFNLAADNLVLNVLQLFIHEKSDPLDAAALDVYPGKVIKINVGEKFETLKMGQVPPAYFEEMKDLQGYFNMANGNMDIANAPTGIGAAQNTATGMNIVVNENNMSFADTITYNKDNFIIPIVEMLVSNNIQFMTKKEMIETLSADQAEAMRISAADMDIDVEFKYMAVGDSSLETKAQKMTKILSIFPVFQQLQLAEQNPDLQNKINFDELYKFIFSAVDIPKEMLKHNVQPSSTQGGPATGLTPQHIMQIVQLLAQKTGLPPNEILEQLVSGKGPQQIMAENPNPQAGNVQQMSSPSGAPPQNAVINPNMVAK